MAIVQVRFPAGNVWEITQKNPILGRGEPFYELDTGAVKVGDGTSRYNDLPYAGIVLEQGPKGDTGAEGPAGRGVMSITADTDSIIFHMTDASSVDVTVPALVEADLDRQAAQAAQTAAELARDDAEAAAAMANDVVGTGVPNATTTTKGGIVLAGDLAGSWDAPLVPGLADKADREYGEIINVYESGDFNTLNFDVPGVYRVHGGTGFVTNMPSTTDLWWNVFVAYDGPTETKLFFATTTNTSSLYGRVKYGVTWGTWVNLASPYTAMSVAEGTAGTATSPRAVRADYLKQIINFYITGAAATAASAIGQSIAKAADGPAVRTLIGAEDAAQKGQPNGYAGLDGTGKVPAAQLPSFVDDALEYANLAAFPATGETGKIYIALDTNRTYRWSGSVYVEISPSDVTAVAGKTGSVTLVRADISDSTSIGRALMGAPNAATARGEIGAGTSNLAIGTTSTTAARGDIVQRVTSLPGSPTAGVLYVIPKV